MGGNTILNLQVLRGFAAMGVAFYHTDYRLAGDFHTEFNGVAIFFVISGFLMCFISQNGERDFLLKRLIRIVPLYWIATLLFLLTSNRLRVLGPNVWLGGDPPLYVETLRSFLFLPWAEQPVLRVGWTLNFEMYFYLVFAVMLAISRRWAPLLTAAFVLAIVGFDRLTGERILLLHYYSHSYIVYFVHGIAVYYVWTWLGRFTPPSAAALCALIPALLFGMQFAHPLWPWWVQAWLWLAPTIVVGAALFMESGGLRMTWRPLFLVGNASYAIYLTHSTWLEVIRPYLRDFGLPTPKDSTGVMLFALVTAGLIGTAIHLWVEKPILAKLRAVLRGPHPRDAAPDPVHT